ncbi:MAG TPA: hypothetical protein VK540_33620 [Polyangiaceae bacterium]|nr:hypothetical protein [Polyangiaceae bacterium]
MREGKEIVCTAGCAGAGIKPGHGDVLRCDLVLSELSLLIVGT